MPELSQNQHRVVRHQAAPQRTPRRADIGTPVGLLISAKRHSFALPRGAVRGYAHSDHRRNQLRPIPRSDLSASSTRKVNRPSPPRRRISSPGVPARRALMESLHAAMRCSAPRGVGNNRSVVRCSRAYRNHSTRPREFPLPRGEGRCLTRFLTLNLILLLLPISLRCLSYDQGQSSMLVMHPCGGELRFLR